jgi:hypothetical protein
MKSRDTCMKERLEELREQYLGRGGTGSRISRRSLLRAGSGTAVVSAVGIAGLLELLENREAIAAGMVIAIVGVTHERYPLSETPHRHSFSVRFQITSVSPSAILGDVAGRTEAVISTGSEREDQHYHLIQMGGVSLEQLIVSGPENNETGEHVHGLRVE